MRKITLILTLVIGFISTSCSNNNDNETQISEFQGNWNGTYTGSEDNGNWSMNVNEEGIITGTATSTDSNDVYDVNGNVQENGNLNVTLGTVTSGATFVGTMNENTTNGTWQNTSENISGIWSGSKN
ncbi:MAG: hypothetical protein GKR88_05695 [Flavobacteriaceae bacterium]|nr:MAG: hypothetical protein GKR88_05695 [Flavobacteriaceae bacterium]